MKILVIGQGGREHALVQALLRSSSVTEVHCLPGNDGIRKNALCHNLEWQNFAAVHRLCLQSDIDVVLIGPEDPLVLGLADYLREHGILVVGPSQEAAQLEGSKLFAKQFMHAAGIRTAPSVTVRSVAEVQSALPQFQPPYVLKADGLAAGKGVFICKTKDDLLARAADLFEHKTLGESGQVAILEKFTAGWELSFLVLTNGSEAVSLPLAQDHKRLGNQDTGPNTGGMGTIAPLQIPPQLRLQIEKEILQPTLQEIKKRGFVYRGILFFGLMITREGPSLLEFNVRLGDPETQVILPLLTNDWGQVFLNLARGQMTKLQTETSHAACVVLAAPGYPDSPQKGVAIDGDVFAATAASSFVHSGTRYNSDLQKWETNGGRVMGAVGLGSTRKEALRNAYAQAAKVTWVGLQKRDDIGMMTDPALTNSSAT